MADSVSLSIIKYAFTTAIWVVDADGVSITIILVAGSFSIVQIWVVGIGMHLFCDISLSVSHLPLMAAIWLFGINEAV